MLAEDSRCPTHTVSHAEQARLEPGLCASVTSATGGAKARTCRAPCTWSGKVAGPGKLNAVAAGLLIHMQDQIINRCGQQGGGNKAAAGADNKSAAGADNKAAAGADNKAAAGADNKAAAGADNKAAAGADNKAAAAVDSRCPHGVARGASQDGAWALCFSHFCYGGGQGRAPCSWSGKIAGPGKLNAVAAGQLIHMQDQIINRRFLVDTGASYRIIPHRFSLPAMGPKLFSPAGQLIPC
jgi:hypothetical protein